MPNVINMNVHSATCSCSVELYKLWYTLADFLPNWNFRSGQFKGSKKSWPPQNVPRNGSKSYCPAKKKHVPQFLKQRDINSYFDHFFFLIMNSRALNNSGKKNCSLSDPNNVVLPPSTLSPSVYDAGLCVGGGGERGVRCILLGLSPGPHRDLSGREER
jgi:hypothetical protein